MRYPIYIFFLMSGFFYLTGNPFSNETSQTGEAGIQGKVAKLKYGRRVSASSSEDKTAEITTTAADAKMVATAKLDIVTAPGKSLNVSDAKRQPGAVANVQEAAPTTSPTVVSAPERESFTEGKAKRFKDPARKPLDWTVFGNKRKNAALTLPIRSRSQDEIDAQGIVGEPEQAGLYNPRKLAIKTRKSKRRLTSKSREIKRAKIRREKLKARKARKNKRLARLKRRNKGVYRIAGKTKKKPVEKKTAVKKSSGKAFGFSFVGAQGRLTH